LCGEPWKVCITHCCDSKQLKVGLGDLLREEKVERDPVLCEPLNEDVGFFVNLNIGIKSYVSLVLSHLLVLLLSFTFLLSSSYVRSTLLSISLVVLILIVRI
jgi:hypothetical protein